MSTTPTSDGKVTMLTKDHRLLIRIMEAKNLPLDSLDFNCVIKIDSNTDSIV